jgi:uncharacterized paraquat-inducible protein A
MIRKELPSSLLVGIIISLTVTVAGAVMTYDRNLYVGLSNQQGYAPVQPIDFSHKVHAKDNAISCQYCHFSADKGPVAGIPAASTCMNCHSEIKKDSPEVQKITRALESGQPIEWVRVHDLPDFVRFDHSAHVRKGVACQTCHGPVQDMARVAQVEDLSMGWCVGCHREYTARPPKGMKNVAASVECATCHY